MKRRFRIRGPFTAGYRLGLRLLAWLGIMLIAIPARSAPRTERDGDSFEKERQDMVEHQIKLRGVKDPATIRAMRRVPRHLFVPPDQESEAYRDYPLPIGYGQTISQPYIVAAMTERLQLTPESRVLEIGTGSGYQAAVLSEIAGEVYSIEIIEPLGLEAKERLQRLGYRNVTVRIGDGYLGWPEKAPFDAIIVTCAPGDVPAPLVEQLRTGGRMCIPVGEGDDQNLYLLSKTDDGKLIAETIFPVRFVPLVRETPQEP